jgi:hypothetical protein
LPRKEVIRQYGQAVICTYVRSATKLPFSQTYSLTQTLLECCSVSRSGRAKLTANWGRGISRDFGKPTRSSARGHNPRPGQCQGRASRAASRSQSLDTWPLRLGLSFSYPGDVRFLPRRNRLRWPSDCHQTGPSFSFFGFSRKYSIRGGSSDSNFSAQRFPDFLFQ